MNSKYFITVILSFVLCLSASAQAGRVSSPDQREQQIKRVTELLESMPRPRGQLPEGRVNPFAPVPREVVAATPPPQVERLTDDRALVAISRNFNPSGSMIVGERRVLRLRDGSMLREGDSFNARIENFTYRVTVSTIDTDGYVLTLGEASMRRRFIEGRGEATPSPRN